MLSPLAAALALGGSADTVRADSLLRELPALVRFDLFVARGDTTPTLLVRSDPPAGLHLAALRRELPYAITWLLEGAPSYDRRGVLRAHPGDSAGMRRALFGALARDARFTEPLLRLAAPLLAARGVVVAGAPAHRPQALPEREAVALAARFFQVDTAGGRPVLTVCAKPALLRARPGARDDAVEAWLYSAVRGGPDSRAVMQAAGAALFAPAAGPEARPDPRAREAALWAALERSEALRGAVRRLAERTRAWAPAALTP